MKPCNITFIILKYGWTEIFTECKSFGISGYGLLLPYKKIQMSSLVGYKKIVIKMFIK